MPTENARRDVVGHRRAANSSAEALSGFASKYTCDTEAGSAAGSRVNELFVKRNDISDEHALRSGIVPCSRRSCRYTYCSAVSFAMSGTVPLKLVLYNVLSGRDVHQIVPETRSQQRQTALTRLTAQSSRQRSPAMYRSGSSSASTCPRPPDSACSHPCHRPRPQTRTAPETIKQATRSQPEGKLHSQL